MHSASKRPFARDGGAGYAARLPAPHCTNMSDLAQLPATPLGRYRHYKGGEYEVIGVARHSETLEPLVVYRPLYNDSGLWVRPHGMFFEEIEHEGRNDQALGLLPAAVEVRIGPDPYQKADGIARAGCQYSAVRL
jgi:hypothetical protein